MARSRKKTANHGHDQESASDRMAKKIAILNERIIDETPARGSAPPSGAVAFESLPLSDLTLAGLAVANYTSMTAIQSASIPHALAGRDILGAAKTGSGKTLSFAVPVLECLYRNKWSRVDGPGAIILSPTRELAGQIFQVLRLVGSKHKSLSVGLLIGGKRDFEVEQQHVGNTNILIATPGRLLQHLEQTPYFNVDNAKMLVLDEADRILDMGFRDQLVRILDYLPIQRQTLLFSATQTKDVKHLATLSMKKKNIEYVGVHDKAETDTPESLKQAYVLVPVQHKLNCVYSFLKTHLKSKTIMFFATCSQVRHAWELFCAIRPGLSVVAMHGKLTQAKRMEIYDKFTRTPHAVLFATDIASRGLDFPNVDWVVQVDAPEDQDMYIHRVGRTARYKQSGNSLLLLDPKEEEHTIGKWTLKLPIKKKTINPTKTVVVTQRAASLVAENVKLNGLAKKAFTSYVRSQALLPDQGDFSIQDLGLSEYATSLGLASMPNLRFLDSITSREGLRKKKNVNRKLQKLKDQIKAEKLAKKVGKLNAEAITLKKKQKKRKAQSDSSSDEDGDDDDLLVVKAQHAPAVGDVDVDNDDEDNIAYDINQVSKSRKAKKIRVNGSTSEQNTRILFDDDGEVVGDILDSAKSNAAVEDSINKEKLKDANDEYLAQVQKRLERTKDLDKQEEKQRIRDKHRKKKKQEKGELDGDDDKEVVVAVLGSGGNDDDGDENQSSSSASSVSGSDSDDSSSSSSSDDDDDDMDVTANEDLALALIRGKA
mmetsp:Transcript_11672/g.33606  ORF Transcript_11672/g.33606 Transcript_11672/m.33606 type:complete len:768 (+) Transcript_11672:115-2418(+)